MKSIVLRLALVCGFFFFASVYESQISAAESRPNILLFLVDDMGVMDTSVPFMLDAQGNPEKHALNDFYRTPNMERLAKQGTRFSQFYAMSVCSPTRVSIMTGQTSARHHTTNWINREKNNAGEFGPDWQWEGITPQHHVLPQVLHDNGYRTIACGKAHFGSKDSYGELPEHFGFDINIAGNGIGQPGSYFAKNSFGKGMKGRHERRVPGLDKYHGQNLYLNDVLTTEINLQITDAVEKKQPFFAYMAHYAVHAPFEADPSYISNYHTDNHQLNVFASMIESMDDSLGKMMDHLDKLGVAQNTLIIFLGDNGTDAPNGNPHAISCAAPLRGKKATQYEGGMRVPFIAAWAKPNSELSAQKAFPVAQNKIIPEMGTVYDIFPTILKCTGIKDQGTFDGRDLSPLLAGDISPTSEQEWKERGFLMHFPHDHRSSYFTVYKQGDWKLIYHYRKFNGLPYELYNLANDRDESHNLADAEPAKLKEMFQAMLHELEKTGAQFPLSDDHKTPLKPTLP
jgi:arylsulfatase A-like enzyme